MSRETAQWLNTQTLIGFTDQRGSAWHYRLDLQGDESNHYPGAIPVGDVQRRLFNWAAEKRSIFMRVNVSDDIEDIDGIDENGMPYQNVEIPEFVSIVRNDNDKVFAIHGANYQIHDYSEWLIEAVGVLVNDTELNISSAGLLRGGARAWVELSLPETIHDEKSGVKFRPNLLAGTALDGSLATTYGRTITNTVCDNTMGIALAQMGAQRVKVKHSKYSNLKIGTAREALALVHETAEQFTEQVRALTEQAVTDKQWFSFLDEIAPLPEEEGRGKTRISNKRDQLTHVYNHDNRCADWKGTAWGVVQTVNTFAHHFGEVRGGTRAERNSERAMNGKAQEADAQTIAAIEKVLSNA